MFWVLTNPLRLIPPLSQVQLRGGTHGWDLERGDKWGAEGRRPHALPIDRRPAIATLSPEEATSWAPAGAMVRQSRHIPVLGIQNALEPGAKIGFCVVS